MGISRDEAIAMLKGTMQDAEAWRIEAEREKAELAPEIAANDFVESMAEYAGSFIPSPLWHGWALREAFLKGVEWARSQDEASRL